MFFEDLKRRGRADPLLVVTDGAPGLIRAVETCFPRALRQRCLVHRRRNLHSKAPDRQWPEIAIRARACYEAASPGVGDAAARGLRAGLLPRATRGGSVLPRRLRRLHRAPALSPPGSQGDPHDE